MLLTLYALKTALSSAQKFMVKIMLSKSRLCFKLTVLWDYNASLIGDGNGWQSWGNGVTIVTRYVIYYF